VISTSTLSSVVDILVDTMGLDPVRAASMQPETPLFGSMPEFDSLAIVEVVALVEERFGFEVDEADITGEVFESVGSLAAYVDANRS
jgi:acyl carrier protein